MRIKDIIQEFERYAPSAFQESYDNSGLIVGSADMECSGVICSLDVTEEVILEAKAAGCNLVVAHHPIIFAGLKKLNGKNYVEKTVITAIKNDIAIFAIHTNLDNVLEGVNNTIANKLGLIHPKVLLPKAGILSKLYTYIPESAVESIKKHLFAAGAGQMGNYSECSFQVLGKGSFKGNEASNPSVGEPNETTQLEEAKIEFLFPSWMKNKVVNALIKNHPYEEVAYEIVTLDNDNQFVGSGLIAKLPEAMEENSFLQMLQNNFNLSVIKHSPLLGKPIKKVALCGGAGSFLLKQALTAEADVFITSDLKYHEFFDADGRILVADIGHWESEQFTIGLLIDILQAKFPTFAVLKSVIKTNPVNYFL
jgi:dinuclear metal center YbgI/SA1388 family protein